MVTYFVCTYYLQLKQGKHIFNTVIGYKREQGKGGTVIHQICFIWTHCHIKQNFYNSFVANVNGLKYTTSLKKSNTCNFEQNHNSEKLNIRLPDVIKVDVINVNYIFSEGENKN